MFDGVEVVLGARCGEFFPVIRGLEADQRVATAGAFLIDAETRLNPSIASTYFGAARTSDSYAERPGSALPPAENSVDPEALLALSPADRALVAEQKLCPVTQKPLGSMGTPTRIEIAGKIVFLCCEGCETALQKNPDKYLPKLKAKP
jgi:hypothetical protein